MNKIADQLRRTFKSIIPDSFEEPDPTRFLSTGILSLDWALGGGFPRGHISHLWGPDGGGKTTTMAPVCVQAQEEALVNGMVLYIATEPKLDQRLFYGYGVDPEKMIFAESCQKDEILDGNIAMNMIRDAVGQVDLIVLDSVAGLAPRIAYDAQSEDLQIGKVAALLSYQLPLIANITATTQTAVIFLNQQRASFAQYGLAEKPFAGYALRHWIANSGRIRSSGWIKHGQDTVGFKPKVTFDKNDFGPPRRTAEWHILWKSGIDVVTEAIMFAKDQGLVTAGGGYYKLGELELNHPGERGAEDAVARVRAEPELFRSIQRAIIET